MPKAKSSRWNLPATQAGEYAARADARDRQDAEVDRANTAAANSKKWNTDEEFMRNVGKEHLKSQQGDMRKTAEDVEAGYEHRVPSYKKGGRVRKTGLAYVHKGEKVTPVKHAARKRG